MTDGTPYAPVPGGGREPLGHLRLDQHERAVEGGQQLQQVQQDGHCHVVRQVRHQRGGRGVGQLPHPQRVGLDDDQPVGQVRGPLGDGQRQRRGQPRVDLHRGDLRRRGQQARG